MVIGVTEGFSKRLEIVGVGYRAEKRPRGVLFNLGFSHPILFIPPPGIDVTLSKPTEFEVSGIDKELVGEVAAKIRSFKPPEPYKGKGIRYVDEYVRRKAGKTVK
jgi:large subunit ribosomal protein L6